MSSSIENIEKVLGAKRFGDRSAQIDWILTDSRSLCFPEETLFFALKTKRNDGHKYLPELYERGVRNFVVGELPADMKSFQDANFLQLANPLKGLQKLAEKHREQFQIPVIGITGSNGKTIVKEWLYQLLSPDRVVTRSPRSYNSQIGVPLSVWLMNERTELAIFEAGISEMGEMEALQTIIKPTVGILTNIGGAHQENFFSLQDKCMEKLTLFKDCDVIIYDGDNELISSCVAKSLFTSRENKKKKKRNGKLAEKHREQFQIPVIGITGSNGKTIVKEWLYQLLSPDRVVTRSPRSYNSQIGVPLSVWLMNEHTELAIFEAGISEMGEMEALQTIIKPTVGILTNIGGAHQENFFSLQDKCMEKLTLFKDCDVIVYDGDNELISSCVAKSLFTSREIAWSKKDNERPLFIESIQKGEHVTTIKYRYLGMPNEFSIPFIDDASIENSLHCLAVALYMMVSPEQITERMARLEQIAMRLEVKEGKNGCVLINDSYNSDLASLDIALDFMSRRSDDKGKKRTLILSDMLETGQSSKLLYRQVAELVHSRGVEKIIGVGEEIRTAAARFEIEKYFFRTTEELLESDLLAGLRNEVILVKGSRAFHFDRISDRLELKVHETILEINLNDLVDNLNYYRSKLKPETKMVCMVKASAYGAGSYEIAKTLQDHRVDYLAVAVADEGSDLRKAGITCSIMIMNPELTAFKTMFDYKLEPEVYSFHLLNELIKAAEKEGVTNFPIHIKLDTGMHRLGFAPEEIPELIDRLKKQTAVIPRSVFSHLVGSDGAQFDSFTRRQIEMFEAASECLQEAFQHKILRHICNTAGIERYPGAQFDMVRLGIGLYGIDPFTNQIIHNVSTLKTTILQIHEVPKEETVGYSRKGHLERDSRIAAIPIGYADGLNRRLGNGHAYCLVNGQKAPYVGNICMDVCMIDVTDIDCKEGDKAIIFGDDLPVTVLSEILETIPYEILTSVSNRVKRVYYQN